MDKMNTKKQNSLKSKIRNTIAGGLVGLLTLLPSGCSSLEKIKKEPIKGYVETGAVSRYVVSSGSSLLNDSHKSLISLRKGPISGSVLYHNERNSAKEELDAWATYSHPLTDKLTLSGTVMTWQYPNKVMSDNNDYLAGASVSYRGIVNLSAGALHLFAREGVSDGESICAVASKNFSFLDGKVNICPEVKLGASRDLFGKSGFRHVSPGVSVSFGKGLVKVNGFLTRQFSLNEDTTDTFTYGGIGLGYEF